MKLNKKTQNEKPVEINQSMNKTVVVIAVVGLFLLGFLLGRHMPAKDQSSLSSLLDSRARESDLGSLISSMQKDIEALKEVHMKDMMMCFFSCRTWVFHMIRGASSRSSPCLA